MTLTQIIQKIRSVFYTKKEIDSMGGGTSLSSTLNSKANDSDVVHTSGNETIEGVKTFSNAIRSSSSNRNKFEIINTNIDITSENEDTSDSIYFYDKNRQYINSISSRIKNNSKYLSIRTKTDDNSDYIAVVVSSTENSFRPEKNGSMNLGTSSNKWKTINGDPPSLLSFPDWGDGFVDITSSVVSGEERFYTPPSDGWVRLNGMCTQGTKLRCADSYRNFGMEMYIGCTGWHTIYTPCRKGNPIALCITATNIGAYFYPCIGNV